jgi:hypothetical protein
VLSTSELFVEMDQIQYGLGDSSYVQDPWPSMLIKKDFNAVLETVGIGLREELAVALDEYLGHDTENWTEFDLNKTLPTVISRAAGRFTVGLPLCRSSPPWCLTLDVLPRCLT